MSLVGAVLALIPLVGVVAWLICPVGFVLSAIGLGLSVSRGTGRGYGIAGVVLAGVGIIICCLYLAAFADSVSSTPSASSSSSSQQSTSSVDDPTETGVYTAGTYTVGQDIAPGTYTTTGSSRCYWARLSGNSGELSDINANDNVEGRGTMSVEPSDRFVEFSGSCTWTHR